MFGLVSMTETEELLDLTAANRLQCMDGLL